VNVNEMTESDLDTGDLVERTLKLARGELSPTAADKLRGRAALGLRPTALEPRRIGAKSALRSWSALRASGKTGALFSAVLLGAGFGAGYWLRGAEPQGVERAVDVPAILATDELAMAEKSGVVEAQSSVALAPQSVARSESSPPLAQAAPAASKGAKRATSRDSEELAIMRRVERALRNGEPALALGLLAELETRLPNTGLTEERSAARVMAHCGLHDAGHQRRAETFLENYPKSVYRARVTAACRMGMAGNTGAADSTSDEGIAPRGDE
jgi:hypothetical protein